MEETPGTNKIYITVVTVLTFVLPFTGLVVEHSITNNPLTFELFGK